MKEIDNRRLNCPEPVLRTKKALADNPGGLISIVDNQTARENVVRFAKNQGFDARWAQKEGDFYIYITNPGAGLPDRSPDPLTVDSRYDSGPDLEDRVILISADQFGRGSEELGRLLMRNYIYTLTERERIPRALIFVNAGVKLCSAGSPVLEELGLLQEKGAEILACGTCLDFFELKDSLSAGRVTNMYDITDLLSAAARVISL